MTKLFKFLIFAVVFVHSCKARTNRSALQETSKSEGIQDIEDLVTELKRHPKYKIDQVIKKSFLGREFFQKENYVLFRKSKSPCNEENGAVHSKKPRVVMFNNRGLSLAYTGISSMSECYRRLEFLQIDKATRSAQMGYAEEQKNGELKVFFEEKNTEKNCSSSCHQMADKFDIQSKVVLPIWDINEAAWPDTFGENDALVKSDSGELEEFKAFIKESKGQGRYAELEGDYEKLKWRKTGINGGVLSNNKEYTSDEYKNLSSDEQEKLHPFVPNHKAFAHLDSVLGVAIHRNRINTPTATDNAELNKCAKCHSKESMKIPFNDLTVLKTQLYQENGKLLSEIIKRIVSQDDDMRMPPPPEKSFCDKDQINKLKNMFETLKSLAQDLLKDYKSAEDLCKQNH